MRVAVVLLLSPFFATGCASNLLHGSPARGGGDTIHAVIEIPAGTTDKWEIGLDGAMHLDRVVDYLGYPANYGIVPGAILGTDLGGDGDPLDVLVLGAAIPRAGQVAVRCVGTIRLVDSGEKDDKIVAVPLSGAFSAVRDLGELDARYPGVTTILRTWFENYKGAGRLQCSGFGSAAEANALIDRCVASYAAAHAGRRRQTAAGR